jgi:hypothetical protein
MDKTFGFDTFRKELNETVLQLDVLYSEVVESTRSNVLTFLEHFDFGEYTHWLGLMSNYRFYRTLGEISDTESFRSFFTANYDRNVRIGEILKSLESETRWEEMTAAVFDDFERLLNEALMNETRLMRDYLQDRRLAVVYEPHVVDEEERLKILHLFSFGPVFENWELSKWLRHLERHFTIASLSDEEILVAAGSKKEVADRSERCVVKALHKAYEHLQALGNMYYDDE